jgi:hypothetical protein
LKKDIVRQALKDEKKASSSDLPESRERSRSRSLRKKKKARRPISGPKYWRQGKKPKPEEGDSTTTQKPKRSVQLKPTADMLRKNMVDICNRLFERRGMEPPLPM